MKINRIVKYQNLSTELKKLFHMTYENGFESFITQFVDPRDGKSYKAVALDSDEYFYLVNIQSLLTMDSDTQLQAELEDEGDTGADIDDAELAADDLADDSVSEGEEAAEEDEDLF